MYTDAKNSEEMDREWKAYESKLQLDGSEKLIPLEE
jgi:hypothetical protein